MRQSEIDEISEAFNDAWKEYFGDKLKYIRFIKNGTDFDDIYSESKYLDYDYDNPIEFYGTLKELETEDVLEPYGKNDIKRFTITFITKELKDKGIFEVNTDDIIIYEQVLGDKILVRKFSIYDTIQKVQFSSEKIFTKLFVKELLCDRKLVDKEVKPNA